MSKNAFIKFLIPLVLACLHNKTRVWACPTDNQTTMFNVLKKQLHWEKTWFDSFRTHNIWMLKNYVSEGNIETVTGLKLISPMMGCAYGVSLNNYHSLMLVAIDECIEMQKKEDNRAKDCRERLTSTIEIGNYVILKLMNILKTIYTDTENDTFYQALSPLKDFLEENPTTIKFAGILPGGLDVYTLLFTVAQSLREFLIFSCRPMYTLFDIDKISLEYNSAKYPNGIYRFYLFKLNFYIDEIAKHLIILGFTEKQTPVKTEPSQNN